MGRVINAAVIAESDAHQIILLYHLFFLGTCKQALGMESGAIADFQITASSAHDMGNVGPQHAR